MKKNYGVTLGIQLAVAFGLFFYLGYRFDMNYDTTPFGILVGVFLGLVYMIYELWKIIRN